MTEENKKHSNARLAIELFFIIFGTIGFFVVASGLIDMAKNRIDKNEGIEEAEKERQLYLEEIIQYNHNTIDALLDELGYRFDTAFFRHVPFERNHRHPFKQWSNYSELIKTNPKPNK